MGMSLTDLSLTDCICLPKVACASFIQGGNGLPPLKPRLTPHAGLAAWRYGLQQHWHCCGFHAGNESPSHLAHFLVQFVASLVRR